MAVKICWFWDRPKEYIAGYRGGPKG